MSEVLPDAGTSLTALGVAEPELPEVADLGAPSLTAGLEALLLVADQPLTSLELAAATGSPAAAVQAALQRLSAEYVRADRGIDVREVAGGWRLYTAASCAGLVTRFATDSQGTRLTQAALETLAVVAYRQPVSRARVAAIRGVAVDGVFRTLASRGLITEHDTEPHTGAVRYVTTGYFLERLGLGSLDELPPIAEHLPDTSALDELAELGS